MPQLLHVRKYPNRRLYDRTRSCHLTHAELYDLVVRGHTVSVTDSRTGTDITSLVLAQALIERSPEKFTAFPPEALHLFIRANEQMLRAMSSGWMAQIMRGLSTAATVMPAARGPAGVGPGAVGLGAVAPWLQPFASFFPTPVAAASPPPAAADASQPAPADDVSELRARLESLTREVASLRSSAPSAGHSTSGSSSRRRPRAGSADKGPRGS